MHEREAKSPSSPQAALHRGAEACHIGLGNKGGLRNHPRRAGVAQVGALSPIHYRFFLLGFLVLNTLPNQYARLLRANHGRFVEWPPELQ